MAITEKYVTVAGGGLHDGSSEANAWTFTEALANAVAGDRVNVKLGTHTCTTASTVNGTYTDPIYVRGYVSTIGDLDGSTLGTRVGGTDIPLVQGNNNNLGFTGKFVNFSHIEFQGTAHARGVWKLGDASIARSCRFTNTSSTSYDCLALGRSVLQDCYLYTPSQYSSAVNGINGTIIDCVLEGVTGVTPRGAYCRTMINCLFKGFVLGAELASDARLTITGCTFVDCTTGVKFFTYGYGFVASSCYFSGCTTAISLVANGSNNEGNVLVNSCCYHNVTTQLSGIDFQYFAKTDSTDQFVDSASGDYTLKPTSNGYNGMEPAAIAGLGTTNQKDIGMIRHQDAGGGGGGGSTHYDPFENPRF